MTEDFYKYLSHDYSAPLTWIHSKVEGKMEYNSLLYINEYFVSAIHNKNMERSKFPRISFSQIYTLTKVFNISKQRSPFSFFLSHDFKILKCW